MKPWFSDDWQAKYARLLRQMRELERLALLAGRKIRPESVKSVTPRVDESA